jgi:hypothetical protein
MKRQPGKLALNRETLRLLEETDLRRLDGVEGGAAAPPTFAVLACYSHLIPTCVCTGTGP